MRLPKTRLGLFFFIVLIGVGLCGAFGILPGLLTLLGVLTAPVARFINDWAPGLLVALLFLCGIGFAFLSLHLNNPRATHDSSLLDRLRRRRKRHP